MLVAADEYLKTELGAKWWVGTPLEHLAPVH
jgi:hypothetical protein